LIGLWVEGGWDSGHDVEQSAAGVDVVFDANEWCCQIMSASALCESDEALALAIFVEKGGFFFGDRKANFSASGSVDTTEWLARIGGDELA
jgi:hypothetical protein